MHFHEVFLGNQHEIWSKQHNGKVSQELSRRGVQILKRSYWRFFAFEMNKSQKGMTQFLIPGGNAAKLFEFVEEPFHLLASLENTEEYNL